MKAAFRHIFCITTVLAVLGLVVTSTKAMASLDNIANFMSDVNGSIVQLRYIKKKVLSSGRGFPVTAQERGLVLVDNETQRELARFKGDSEKYGLISGAYALDSQRIVCQFLAQHKQRMRKGTAIWDLRDNSVKVYEGKWNREFADVPAINPLLTRMITLPDRTTGLVLHDLAAGSSIRLFQEWHICYPRFSPDGSRYAFFAGENNEANLMVIQQLSGGAPTRFEIERQENEKTRPQGRNLAWSPSGKLLAGVVYHDYANKKLYVWNADGSLMTMIPISFQPGLNWAPLWSADETKIILFERERMPGEKNMNVKPLAMHKVRIGK
jgi:hypothetical protein